MFLAVTIAALAIASDPALLAPGPDELSAAFEHAELYVSRASTIERALSRLHNRWAEIVANPAFKSSCDDPETRSIAARSRVLGDALRDEAQSGRAHARRLARVFVAPTVSAVIDPKMSRRHQSLQLSVAQRARRYGELRAWHHRYIEAAVKKCTTRLTLEPTVGLASRALCAGKECSEPIAIIGVGGGKICPTGVAANKTVAIVIDGQACYGVKDCACVPVPVLPGAILGP